MGFFIFFSKSANRGFENELFLAIEGFYLRYLGEWSPWCVLFIVRANRLILLIPQKSRNQIHRTTALRCVFGGE